MGGVMDDGVGHGVGPGGCHGQIVIIASLTYMHGSYLEQIV